MGPNVSLHSESPDIVVPKLGIPFNAVAQLARTLLGSHRWHIDSPKFRGVRTSAFGFGFDSKAANLYAAPDGIDPSHPTIPQSAAFAVFAATTPYTTATYYADRNPDRARKIAVYITTKSPKSDLTRYL